MSGFAQEFRAGWRQILGAAIGLGLGIGAYTPVSSLFFRALENQYAWSKAASSASLIALPITAAALPAIGMLVDRFGVRRVGAVSALCLAACYFALAAMSGSLAQFYVLILCLNVLGAGTGPITYTRPIAAHFSAGRGAALALALMGIAAAGVLLPVLLQHRLAETGWRAAYRSHGCRYPDRRGAGPGLSGDT